MLEKFLRIQNPGVAPLEGYTILGVSTTRNSGRAGTIGQFGSGSKHAVGLLLRNNINPVVFLGKLRLDFDVEHKTVDDGLSQTQYGQVRVKLSGQHEGKMIKRTENLGFSLDFGSYDWNNVNMAMREFVSNAIDRTIREEGGFQSASKDGRLSVELEDSVRAKDGYTRIFVPATPEVLSFFSELGWRFLHFGEPHFLNQKLLPKRRRGINPFSNNNETDTATIYKNGVFVRKVRSLYPSLFDYNFTEELSLDECRNVNDSTVTEAVGGLIKNAEPAEIKQVLQASLDRNVVWEIKEVPQSYISPYWEGEERRKKISAKWQEAYRMVAADCVAVPDNNPHIADYVEKKGHNTAVFDADLVRTLHAFGILTAEKVLSSLEKSGYEECPVPFAAFQASQKLWKILHELGMTNNREFPVQKCFVKNMDGGSLVKGKYENNTVYTNKLIADGGITTDLLTTLIEEHAHHITMSGDMSRDLQDFAFTFAAQVLMKYAGVKD